MLKIETYVNFFKCFIQLHVSTIVDAMVSMLAPSAVLYHMCSSPFFGQTKDYKIDICCFSTKKAEIKIKNKPKYHGSSE